MKKVMFGLLVAATAAGMSAFTNAPANSRQAMRYWINNGSGNYVERTSVSPQESCAETSQFDCAVQSQNTSIPSTFPVTNPSNYPVTAHPESSKALYLE